MRLLGLFDGKSRRIGTIARGFQRFAAKALSIVKPFYPTTMIRTSVTPSDTNRGLAANVVMACIFWIQRVFTEGTLVIQRRTPQLMWERVVDHRVETLIARPNAFYDGDALWKATVLSYVIDGNSYWWKVRNVFGEVIQLWYVPHWMIAPVSDTPGSSFGAVGGGSTFIRGYQLLNGLRPVGFIARDDVVHFRFGLDPEDTRVGISPLKCLMREIEADISAAEFTGAVLGNMGIPGLVIAPKDSTWAPTPAQVKELKDYIDGQAFRGENSGKTLVFGKPAEILQLGGSDPNKVMLPALRDIAEERVCAVIGVPAAVVGFGSGLQSTKVGATMRELVKAAWVTCLSPMQTTFANAVSDQLLPDFHAQLNRFRAAFDMTDASSFQEEFDLRARTLGYLVEKGILRVDRAQHQLGLEVDPAREVYLGPAALGSDPSGNVLSSGETGTRVAEDATSDTTDEAVQKMLAALADRLAITNGSNGNGTH